MGKILRVKMYVVVGASALCILGYWLTTGFKPRTAIPKELHLWWSVATGSALLGCMAYQWKLLFSRLSGRMQEARRHYQRHRWVGALALCLFVLHAGGMGYALVTVLAVVFLAMSAAGLLNAEIVPLRSPRFRRGWGYVHIGLSGLLLPLIAFHVWAALAFK